MYLYLPKVKIKPHLDLIKIINSRIILSILSQQLMEGGINGTKTAVKYANFDDQLLQDSAYLEADANGRKLQ